MVNLVGERGRPLSRGSHADEVDQHCEREDVWTPIQAAMHAWRDRVRAAHEVARRPYGRITALSGTHDTCVHACEPIITQTSRSPVGQAAIRPQSTTAGPVAMPKQKARGYIP